MNTYTHPELLEAKAECLQDLPVTGCPRCARSPWLDILSAARWAGYACTNGRAPNSIYKLAARIGHKLNGQWRVHRDDLDAALRGLI